MQFTVQITKLNRLAKTYREHICSRIETLAHRLTAKKFDWENSDIKWMKIASINSIVTNTSQFHFFSNFLGRIKVNYKRFAQQLYFEDIFLPVMKVIWDREKREN